MLGMRARAEFYAWVLGLCRQKSALETFLLLSEWTNLGETSSLQGDVLTWMDQESRGEGGLLHSTRLNGPRKGPGDHGGRETSSRFGREGL